MKRLPRATRKQLKQLYDTGPFPEPTLYPRLPIRGLFSMQDILVPDQVAYYKRLTPDHEPVRIVLWKGSKFIWDGHHRIHARLNKGLKTVRAFVYDVKQ